MTRTNNLPRGGVNPPDSSFISREAPTEARGFLELDAPIIKEIAGMVKRYKTTIKSPANPSEGERIALPKIVAARTRPKRPR